MYIMKDPEWVVKNVQPQKDFTLLLTFADKTTKIFDMKPLLNRPAFRPLKNFGLFSQAKAEYGTVVWNEEIDIAPEYLYECGKSIAI